MAVRTRNLAIAFASLCGYAERVGRQGFDEAQRLLRVWEALAEPTFVEFGGRRVKQIGGTFLVAFESPTQAVLCAAALQARAALYAEREPQDDRLEIRVGLQLGEVRLVKGDVFGEAVNAAARVEALAGPGDVFLGEALWLSMDRGVVEVEELGLRELRGLPEPVRLFAVRGSQLDLATSTLPSIERLQPQSEIASHLREAWRAAGRLVTDRFEPFWRDVWPAMTDRARVFVGAGVAAVALVLVTFLLLTLGGQR